MRVEPHLPSRPLTATVIESWGAALFASSAAKRPAPAEPRMKISASSRCRGTFLALHDELRNQHRCHQAETDRVEQGLRVDQKHAGDEQHQPLVGGGLLEEPAL